MRKEDEAHRTAERVARESYGRLVALLAARTRDIATAEDALAEAFSSALENWPRSGVPDNPAAWLLTAARRKHTDELRKAQTRATFQPHVELMAEELNAENPDNDLPDKRLSLMFACAHPAIDASVRTPLILQTVLGLNADAIGRAFLISPKTMGQRLVRAKSKIRDAGIGLSLPRRKNLADRVQAVLNAIYAIYSRGWAELGETGTPAFVEEAVWLGRLIVQLLPDDPEAKGMLSLMLYAEARRPARLDANGEYVPLEEQDTQLWDRKMLGHAEALLRDANRVGASGRYQIEAAIQSAHIARLLTGQDTWPAIVRLYDHLHEMTASPVVLLNRAVASSHIDGPHPAIARLRDMRRDDRMQSFQPYWAALGHLLAQTGNVAESHEALTVAIGMSSDPAERRHLLKVRAALQPD